MTEKVQQQSIADMAYTATDGLYKAAEAAAGAASTNEEQTKAAQSQWGSDGSQSKKIKALQQDMVNIHSSQPMTTDFGQKVTNTDNWLKIANDKTTGPHLLEDQSAREKVSTMFELPFFPCRRNCS